MKSRPLDIGPGKSKMVRTGRVISNLASPPMVSAVLGFITALATMPFLSGLVWGFVFGFFVSLVPLLTVVYLLRTGRVHDLHLETAKDRRVPYLVGVLGSAASFILVMLFEGPIELSLLALANLVGLVLLGVINNVWLISSHMAAITMGAFFIAYLFGWKSLVVMVPLVALVFAVRYFLQRHTIMQLLAGMAVGAISVLAAGYQMLNYL
jgi:hypothetical protein